MKYSLIIKGLRTETFNDYVKALKKKTDWERAGFQCVLVSL